MAKYRKKPKIDEADQWFPDKKPWPAGVHYEQGSPPPGMPPRVCVTTIHGQEAYLSPGDFVVTEPDGVHHYPCKPDIFLAGHDLVDE